ncbi:MAG: D-alanine--D-alanine ligase family protein [bacterium]|nr:D-alanine--D-alanine ligase family protein [bacterium]
MNKKLRVAVLMGGKTAEHAVSLKSGMMVVNNLDKQKYLVKPVIITKQGLWLVPNNYISKQVNFKNPKELINQNNTKPVTTGIGIDKLLNSTIEVVFLAMHGPYGEDGTIQGLFELAEIPYTGSGVLGSSLAMNKIKTLEMLEYWGILTPKRLVITEVRSQRAEVRKIQNQVKMKIGLPCVIKPNELGSSVAIQIIKHPKDLIPAIKKALRYDRQVIVEQYISGKEITCSVLGTGFDKEPIALPPTMIIPKTSEFFDYHAKYTAGATDEITPAPIGNQLTKKVQQIAVAVHQALCCGSMSRTDIIIQKGKIYVFETNTIPGMTAVSLLPQAAKAAGISFPKLLDKLIQLAIEEFASKQKLKS